MHRILLLIWLSGIFIVSTAQVKNTQAVKIIVAPRIDGSLDDAAWQQVPVATDFITNSPEFGKPASSRTTVKVVYDNTAIYIGAYIYDDPLAVRRQFTPRDNGDRSDVD